MEGLVAVSLASNVLQFVDFSLRTVSQFKEIYHSTGGASQKNEALESLVHDTDQVCERMRKFIDETSSGSAILNQDSDLVNVILHCVKCTKRLTSTLDSVRAKPGKREAILKAIQGRWKQDEIDELQRELESCKSNLQLYMTASQLHRADHTILLQQEMSKQLGEYTESMKSGLRFLRQGLQSTQDFEQSLAMALLGTLSFPEIDERNEQIGKPHEQTFTFIFEQPTPNIDTSTGMASAVARNGVIEDNFVAWLQHGSGTFWLKGKAGSGKSTLMNHIIANDTTSRALKQWSAGGSLIMLHHFFWNSGVSILQRSQQGLLRTVLSQILRQDQTTVRSLQDRFSVAQLATLTSPEARNSFWTKQKLMQTLSKLISHSGASRFFCFFVDGLDELGTGNESEYQPLIDTIRQLSSYSHVKLCVSSRPLTVFQEAFEHDPSLQLEMHTADDIRLYVDSTLRTYPAGLELATDLKTIQSYQKLISSVAEKSSGVFLWVKVVVDTLIKTLRRGGTMEDLEMKIQGLPTELIDLFRGMVAMLEPDDREEAARTFRTILANTPVVDKTWKNTPQQTILDLLFAQDASVHEAIAYPVRNVDWALIDNRISRFKRRIAYLCCGLIEFIRGPPLGDWLPDRFQVVPRFLHRSVKDFLMENNVFPDVSLSPEYTDYERFLAARVMVMKTMLGQELTLGAINTLADYSLSIAKHVEVSTGKASVSLVDEVDVACIITARMHSFPSWYSPKNANVKRMLSVCSQENHASVHDSEDGGIIDLKTTLDMFSYAIASELYLYGSEKIATGIPIHRDNRMPLLHALHVRVEHDLEERINVSDPGWQKLLLMLLEHGADPNLIYYGKSAWELRLEEQALQDSHLPFPRGIVPQDFYTFLEHGASHDQTINVKSILSKLFDLSATFPKLVFVYADIIQVPDRIKADSNASPLNDLELREILESARKANKVLIKVREEDSEEDEIGSEDFALLLSTIFQVSQDLSRTRSKAEMENMTDFDNIKLEDILLYPEWQVSILYWATYCLGLTTQITDFVRYLVSKGAAQNTPQIVGLKAVMGLHPDQMVHIVCDANETASLTAAWQKAFPRYSLSPFSRLITAASLSPQIEREAIKKGLQFLSKPEVMKAVTDVLSEDSIAAAYVQTAFMHLRLQVGGSDPPATTSVADLIPAIADATSRRRLHEPENMTESQQSAISKGSDKNLDILEMLERFFSSPVLQDAMQKAFASNPRQ